MKDTWTWLVEKSSSFVYFLPVYNFFISYWYFIRSYSASKTSSLSKKNPHTKNLKHLVKYWRLEKKYIFFGNRGNKKFQIYKNISLTLISYPLKYNEDSRFNHYITFFLRNDKINSLYQLSLLLRNFKIWNEKTVASQYVT